MNQILALNSPWKVDKPLNKWTKYNLSFSLLHSFSFTHTHTHSLSLSLSLSLSVSLSLSISIYLSVFYPLSSLLLLSFLFSYPLFSLSSTSLCYNQTFTNE